MSNLINVSDEPKPKLIDLKGLHSHPVNHFLFSLIEKPVESMLAIDKINRIYERTVFNPKKVNPFQAILAALNVGYQVGDLDFRHIPNTGPLLIAANHPFGGIEGVILGDIVTRVRSDVRILANYLLQQITELSEYIIPVDPFGSKGSRIDNGLELRKAIRWVRQGGALITFPSGTVSHFHLMQGKVVDPPWNPHIGGIVRRTNCAVLPVFVPGRNGIPFQVLGMIHPVLRTMMLPRELVNKASKTISIKIGKPISMEKIRSFTSDAGVTEHLRQKTYMLANRENITYKEPVVVNDQVVKEPVIGPIPVDAIVAELKHLDAASIMVDKNDYTVYLAQADQIPNTLLEIGRLREITFRTVGEGTGKAFDLDRFDAYYLHLFIWHKREKEIVGAYRLTPVDVTLDKYGIGGLYTSTLFRYKKGILEALSKAVELGRSWIREEYQRQYQCLSLLWQGIGKYISAGGSYHTLFGPVSISREYHYISRYLLVRFLQLHRYDQMLSKQVTPLHPYRYPRFKYPETVKYLDSIDDLEAISLIISEIERDGKGIPVLLRQYLKLNARILSFNVDPDFADVIDGLIMTDLRITDQRILRRFMGEEGLTKFQKTWHTPLELAS